VKGSPAKPTVTIKLAAGYDLKTDTAAISQGDLSIGKATARLSGTYQTQGPVSALNLKLDGKDMPIDEFVAALPALGLVFPSGVQPKGGALTVNFTVTGGSDNPVTTGSLGLSNMKLAGFDMRSKLSAIPGLSGRQAGGKDTVIQNLSANVRVAPEATTPSAINVTIPSLGVVTGAGSISPAGALKFNMVADLAGAEGSRAQKGSGVPFAIEGTTSDPKFVPNIKGIAGAAISSKVKSEIPRKRRR
jgi:AsmA protein